MLGDNTSRVTNVYVNYYFIVICFVTELTTKPIIPSDVILCTGVSKF